MSVTPTNAAVKDEFMDEAAKAQLKNFMETGQAIFMSPSTDIDDMWKFINDFMAVPEEGFIDSETRMLMIQRFMSLRTQFFGLLTNVLKAVDDVSQRIIGNIR